MTPSGAAPAAGASTVHTPVPIVALDRPDAESALAVVAELGTMCSFYKVGSELFTAAGPSIVQALSEAGQRVFLDLKYHDIPNTVRAACHGAARIGARLVTVHAAGGVAMMAAAVEGARAGVRDRQALASGRSPLAGPGDAAGGCEVLAVTVLTSMDADELSVAWGRQRVALEDEVVRLAGLARRAGVAGVVCGGAEAARVRHQEGPGLKVLVPGVRLTGSATHDQKRVVSAAVAARVGADYVVVGRTVTGATPMRDAMTRVLAELASPP